MSHEEGTVTIRYVVSCGNPSPGGFRRTFEYSEQAPASLCRPHDHTKPNPNEDSTGVFLTSIIERYNTEILLSHPWGCVTCDKPAKELLNTAVPLLSPNISEMTAEFRAIREPAVFNTAAPICRSGGSCDRAAEKMVYEFAKDALMEHPWQEFETTKTCDKCGKKSGLKLCGGCKFIAYCSKECQRQSWPHHKKQCKRAKKELNEAGHDL